MYWFETRHRWSQSTHSPFLTLPLECASACLLTTTRLRGPELTTHSGGAVSSRPPVLLTAGSERRYSSLKQQHRHSEMKLKTCMSTRRNAERCTREECKAQPLPQTLLLLHPTGRSGVQRGASRGSRNCANGSTAMPFAHPVMVRKLSMRHLHKCMGAAEIVDEGPPT